MTTDSTSQLHARGQAIKAKIASLAASQGIPYNNMATLFLLERAAYRLVLEEKLAKHLVFKGGFVSLRIFSSPRFTTDLDAVLNGIPQAEAIELIKSSMTREINDAVWFYFMEAIDLKHQNEYGGFRFSFKSGLGEKPRKIEKSITIHLDIGTGDPIVPAPLQLATPFIIGGGEISWQVYPVETILAEKIHTLIQKGDRNSRSKDIFDIYTLLPKANVAHLEQALKATFSYRNTPFTHNLSEQLNKISHATLKLGWVNATQGIEPSIPFEQAFGEIVQKLKQLGF